MSLIYRSFNKNLWFSSEKKNLQHLHNWINWFYSGRRKLPECLDIVKTVILIYCWNVTPLQFSAQISINGQSVSSVTQYVQLCDPMVRSTPGLPVHHQLPEFTQTHVHWVGDAIQPCHPLSSPSPPALNLSQHQGLFPWVSSSHQVAKVLEFQPQYQSFQWTSRTDIL